MATNEDIRAWVYEFLRKKSSVNQTPSSLALGLSDIEVEVKSKLQQCNEMSPTDFHRDIPTEYQDFIREVVWGLVIQGIVIPGADARQASFPFFQITNWGKQCLQNKEYLPHDAGLYIRLLKTQVPQVDANIIVYLQGIAA